MHGDSNCLCPSTILMAGAKVAGRVQLITYTKGPYDFTSCRCPRGRHTIQIQKHTQTHIHKHAGTPYLACGSYIK